MTLYQITFTVNFVALIASLWLGMYLVTRNPRVPTAWLTAFTLWSLGGLFINVLLALNPPPDPAFRPMPGCRDGLSCPPLLFGITPPC
jgi:hypothetical protein